jgi:hypothetical protein
LLLQNTAPAAAAAVSAYNMLILLLLLLLQVRYVIALLRDLLVALDVAQRVLGFAHYDLK